MWKNREFYNGLSVLPFSGGNYVQAPFEDCDEATYKSMIDSLKEIDLTKIIEVDDNTNLSGEVACAGGACEVKFI
jgi:ribonucleoside-diphosphate reductase alpha chain